MRTARALLTMLLILCHQALSETLGNYTSHEIAGNRLVIHAGIPAISVQAYTEQIVRVGLYPDGEIADDLSPVVVLAPQNPAVNISETDSTLTYSTASLAVMVRKQPLRLSFSAAGQSLLADTSGFFWDGAARGVRYVLEPSEHIWGGGERAASLDHRGERLEFYNAPSYCYGVGAQDLNIAIPFIISSRGYGLYFDDSYPGYLDLGQSAPGVTEYRVEGGGLSTFFIRGATPAGILEAYIELTGRQPLPPRWALGYLQSRFGYQSEQEARSTVTQFRAQHIPLDALILDLYWFGWGQMGDLDWDYSHWPNPSDMLSDFDSLGVKTILITEPYIQTASSNWNIAQANDYVTPDSAGNPVVINDFWAGAAGLLDITNPPAADWFWSFYQNLVNQGVGGWWCDLGEPEAHPPQMVHVGGSAARVHNIYSLLWAKRLYEGYQTHFPEQRLFNLIRSGYAGMQRFGTFPWSGDVQRSFEGLQAQLPILLNMGLSGVAFQGSDIGGFDCGAQNPELYIRWMQFGAFSPMMRAHGVGVPTEPIYYDAQTRQIVSDFIRLRYQLMPYNYTLAWVNHNQGYPLARPVWFAELNDVTANLCDEYLWGNDFLVAPVMQEGAMERGVYLPAGPWINYWDDTRYDGPTWLNVSAPLARLPLFVRDGAVIPMATPFETTRDYDTDTLLVHHYPDLSGPGGTTFMMYNDDGETPDAYASGQYERLGFNAWSESSDASLAFWRDYAGYPGAPSSRKIITVLHRVSEAPDSVSVGDHTVAQVTDSASFYALDTAAWWDPVSHLLRVGFIWPGDNSGIEVHGLHVLGVDERPMLPHDVNLSASYPNPFNAATTIAYTLTKATEVEITVWNVNGRLVRTLVNGSQTAGEHRLAFDATKLASGLYFCRLSTPSEHFTQKLVLLR